MGAIHLPGPFRLLDLQETGRSQCVSCAKIHRKTNVDFFVVVVFQLSIQLALSGFAEFILHLTRLGPEMLQIAQDSGRLTVSYSRFEVDDTKGKAFPCGKSLCN